MWKIVLILFVVIGLSLFLKSKEHYSDFVSDGFALTGLSGGCNPRLVLTSYGQVDPEDYYAINIPGCYHSKKPIKGSVLSPFQLI